MDGWKPPKTTRGAAREALVPFENNCSTTPRIRQLNRPRRQEHEPSLLILIEKAPRRDTNAQTVDPHDSARLPVDELDEHIRELGKASLVACKALARMTLPEPFEPRT
jgi:hypothetical protein